MKVVIFLLTALLVQAFAKPLDEPIEVFGNSDEPSIADVTKLLMENATDYQGKASELQKEINAKLFLIRNVIVEVLEKNMNETVKQTDIHSQTALGVYLSMEEKLEKLVKDDCYLTIKGISDGYINTAGFQISNILNYHDGNVTEAIGDSEEIIKKFDYTATNIQRLVMKSFIKRNLFKTPELISDTFVKNLDDVQAEWDEISPSINQIVLQLRDSFDGTLDKLSAGYKKMQTVLDSVYNTFEMIGINVCNAWSNTNVRAFSAGVDASKYKNFDVAKYFEEIQAQF